MKASTKEKRHYRIRGQESGIGKPGRADIRPAWAAVGDRIRAKPLCFSGFCRHTYRGARWNEKTCVPGRRVTLSCGYGTARRLPRA
jgi:hypothetical protein